MRAKLNENFPNRSVNNGVVVPSIEWGKTTSEIENLTEMNVTRSTQSPKRTSLKTTI